MILTIFHLLVFAFVLDVATSSCDDSSLSIYVADDGNIRARFTTQEMVSDDGIIHTMCGLKCGCFENIFLCCSEADCIHMDHECSEGSHGSYSPPIPFSDVGRAFVVNPSNSVLIAEQPEVDFEHLHAIEDSHAESDPLQLQPRLIEDSGSELGNLKLQPHVLPESAHGSGILQIPSQVIQDSVSGNIHLSPQLVQDSDNIHLQPDVLPESRAESAIVQVPHRVIQDSGSGSIQLSPQLVQDSASGNIQLSPQLVQDSGSGGIQLSPQLVQDSASGNIQLSPQLIQDSGSGGIQLNPQLVQDSDSIHLQPHVLPESGHESRIVQIPPHEVPDINDNRLVPDIVHDQEHIVVHDHPKGDQSLGGANGEGHFDDLHDPNSVAHDQASGQGHNSHSVKKRSIGLMDLLLRNRMNRAKRDAVYMEDAFTTMEATTPQETEEEEEQQQNSHSVKKRGINLVDVLLRSRVNRAKRGAVYMEDAFTTPEKDDEEEEEEEKETRKKRAALEPIVITTEMGTTAYSETNVEVTESPVITTTSYKK